MGESLSGQKVLVTGADGFIGSHLVEHLVRVGADVRALTFYNSWNSLGWLEDVPGEVRQACEILTGDIRDAERVRAAVEGVAYVFHLSSLIAIPYSYHAARSYVETNVTGALNVLEACRASDTLVRLVHTSTSEVYGSAQTVPISERHPLNAQSPYAATKIGADMLALSYQKSFETPVLVARPFNTFGPRQTARAVIPTIASQLLDDCKELVLGALTPTRDFNFVTDTAAGLAALAVCREAEGETVNIGTGREWSIEETARLLMEVTGREVPIVCDEQRLRPAGSEVDRLLADNSRILELTDWRPRVEFRDGLDLTAQWIGRNLHRFQSANYSV